jgi:hypothetical protein
MELRAMRIRDLPGVVAAWHAANIARGKPPTPQHVARIIEKLQEPDALPYVAAEGDAIVGMARYPRLRSTARSTASPAG